MSINLLPWREQLAIRQSYQYGLWLLISAVCIMFIAAGAYYYLNSLRIHYQWKNKQLAQHIAATNTPNDIAKLTADYQITQQQIQLINSIQTSQSRFWREISWLQQQTPQEIQLTHLTWAPILFRLQAMTIHPEKIGLFVQSLEGSQLFSATILENVDQAKNSQSIHFAIHAGRIQESLV